jgi:signal transduction histidine kinase
MAKVLVIEDTAPLLEDIVEMLRLEGYEATGALNGFDGLRLLDEFQPDVIICDIMMPGMDGYTVLKSVRAHNTFKTLPFIFLTAKGERGDMRRGMGLGANDYVTKPFENSELLQTIQTRLKHSQTLEEQTEQKLTQLRDSIITALPHELRTPLNTIIGFADLLVTESETLHPTQVAEWASHIGDAGQRLNRMIENYLTYVRIQSMSRDAKRLGKLQSQVTPDAVTLAEHQAIYFAQANRRETDLMIERDRSVPAKIADSDLTKIMEELFDNAFKFSEPGQTILLQTGLDTSASRPMVWIRVQDFGRGMTSEQIQSVGLYMQFDRLIHEQRGTGLGLAIARGLAEMYRGTLDLESSPGEYTALTLRLPVADGVRF